MANIKANLFIFGNLKNISDRKQISNNEMNLA